MEKGEKAKFVSKVIHPGLPSHPQHELAKRQMKGFSGMCSFVILGGIEEATLFLQSLKVYFYFTYLFCCFLMRYTSQSAAINKNPCSNILREEFGIFPYKLSLTNYIQVFALAESLGGYESLAELP